MTLTSIGDQRTPGRPIELTFAAETGLPSANQEVLIIGRKEASGTATAYEVIEVANSGDRTAASGEITPKFGATSELTKMVLAAIKANEGESTLPAIKVVALEATDVDFGTSDAALTAAARVKHEYIVSPFAATSTTLRTKLKDHCALVSGAQRVENQQFGTIGVAAEMAEADPTNLDSPDTQYLSLIYFRDTATGGDANPYGVGEVAAAAAAVMARNGSPFNPLDNETIVGITAPTKLTDYLTIGSTLESETVLDKGWTPLKVKPNGEVAFVRTITTRITVDADGVTAVTAYYDVQDFNVLYFWRKTLFTRFNQSDWKQRKASVQNAKLAKSEAIRLAKLFEDQNMFQAVDDLASSFEVERSTSDRHRFDIKTPVNVIPGLHVIATNIEATTEFDSVSV